MKNEINQFHHTVAPQVFRQCLARLASLHDLPEILTAEITQSPNPLILGTEIEITPRGQISLIIEKLKFSANLCFFDGKPLFRLKAELNYQHVSGGSNGKSVDFLGSFETRYGGADVSVTSLVEEGAWHRLYREMNAV